MSGAHSITECAGLLGNPPQGPPGDKVITEEAGPSQARPLLALSPVCEEIHRTVGGNPSGDDHGPSKVSLIGQESRPPSQPLTLTWQSGTMDWAERSSLQLNSSSAMAKLSKEERVGVKSHKTPTIR